MKDGMKVGESFKMIVKQDGQKTVYTTKPKPKKESRDE